MADTYTAMCDRWPVNACAFDQGRLAYLVTTSDTMDLTNPAGSNTPSYAKELWIGVSGDIAVVMAGDKSNSGQGTAVTFKAAPAGRFPYQVRRVMATNTTATNIVAIMD